MTLKILKKLNNRYFWVSLAFLLWLLFFDRYNLIFRYKTVRELKSAHEQKDYYKEQIRKDNKAIKELITDTNTLEKFAREKYLMKKDNEDIFLIEKEEKEKK